MSDFVYFLDFPTAVPVASPSVLSGDIDAGTINSVGWDVVVVVTFHLAKKKSTTIKLKSS